MNELRFALRQIARRPGAALVIVLTLALGIGASVALFSVVHGVLLKPLPYPGSERIVRIHHLNDSGSRSDPSDPDFADLRERSRTLRAAAQYGAQRASVVGARQPARVMRAQVSEDFFRVIGVTPVLGREFAADELVAEGAAAVIVSARFWREQLDARATLDGLRLRIDEREHAVVGVMPDGFDFPQRADVWTPVVASGTSRTAHNWRAFARMAPDVTAEQASAELNSLAAALRAEHAEQSTLAGIALVPLHSDLLGRVQPLLVVLLAAAGLLFLTALANVGGMLLARLAARQQELSVRVALGAGRSRLVRQFVIESAMVVLAGTVAGVALAALGLRAFHALSPHRLPRMEQVGIDSAALGFSLGLCLLGVGLLALLLAWRAGRAGFAADANRRDGGGHRRQRTARALVVGQVTLALVLLVGASLLGRSFHGLLGVDPGFDNEGALVMQVAMPWPADQEDRARQARFRETLLARLAALPGVDAVAYVNLLPMTGRRWNGSFLEVARRDEVTDFESFERVMRMPGRVGNADFRQVSADYFAAMGIALVDGRGFASGDVLDGTHVALISEGLAARQWPSQNPLGKLIQFGNMDGNLEPFTVVGVVADVRDSGLDAPPNPTVYALAPQRQSAMAEPAFVMRTSGDPWALSVQARRVLAELDPHLPPAFTTLDDVVAASLAERRFALTLVGVFGLCALLLALSAVYAAVAFSLSQRTGEIGVRLALGARAGAVVAMLVGEGLRTVLAGIALGLAAAVLASRLAAAMLHAVGSLDAAAYLIACLLLLAAAALASWLPARRAARVDPAASLRSE